MFVLQAQKTPLSMVRLPRTAGGRLAARGKVCICFLSDLNCFMSSSPFIRIGDVKALEHHLIAASAWGHQELYYASGWQWDRSSVSAQVEIVLSVVCCIIALRYLPLGVLPSWSRSMGNITFVLSLEFAQSFQTLGTKILKFFIG